MSQTPHELHEKFPQSADRIGEMRQVDAHFARLADEYPDVNRKVHRAETLLEPMDALAEMDLCKERSAQGRCFSHTERLSARQAGFAVGSRRLSACSARPRRTPSRAPTSASQRAKCGLSSSVCCCPSHKELHPQSAMSAIE